MIDLYGSGGPNVMKVAITLEEIGLKYRVRPVAMLNAAARTPEFLALNPLGKVPVLVDPDGLGKDNPLCESGAIILYLAEKHAPALFPAEGAARWRVVQWVMTQMSLAGPMLGQLNHFQLIVGQEDSYALKRYRDQAARVYGDFNKRLAAAPWLAGDFYSLADIAMYPWTAYVERHGFQAADFPFLDAWRKRIEERPAVLRAGQVLQDANAGLIMEPLTEQDINILFNRSEAGPGIDWEGYVALGPMSRV